MSSNAKSSEEEHEEEYEEALSLRDLPTSEENSGEAKREKVDNHEEEFNFGGSSESKMCAADEVFFQGQILPKMFTSNTSGRCFSRSESNQSTDHFTSRSSSINSHRSSSSGSSSSFSTATAAAPPRRPKFHNQFQFSHPSPKPKPKPNFQNPSFKNSTKPNRNSPSPIWSFLRVGLVAPPPEIKLRSKSSGSSSRNSTSSAIKEEGDKKQSGKFPGKKRVLFNLSGCSCTANAVVGPVASAPLNAITRNPTAKEESEEDNSVELKKKRNDDEKKSGATGKQSASRHRRTFEWLKQLSLEETAAAVTVIDRQ